MKINVSAFIVSLMCMATFSGFASAQVSMEDFASSPNPVGSGGRALGMGGAFISMADDATAASWNPAGLVQLKKPEVAIVGAGYRRSEDIEFGAHDEASGTYKVSEMDLNYLSIAYPFNILDRNMTISLTYQNLYDFKKEQDFQLVMPLELLPGMQPVELQSNYKFRQKGNLSALGIAYSVQMWKTLSMGLTLNIWDDNVSPNKWERTLLTAGNMEPSDGSFQPIPDYRLEEEYTFKGFNANLGVLWEPVHNLKLGFVFKTPFSADIEYKGVTDNGKTIMETHRDDELDMPMSYGFGLSYRFSDRLTMAADIYRTEWQDFIFTKSSGEKTSPITNQSPEDSDIDPTHQARIGAEYLIINMKSDPDAFDYDIISLRGGLFYDPYPAAGSPDDCYGLSLGSGIKIKQFLFDIAYQFRYGNNVSKYSSENIGNFSKDVKEHVVYFSLVYYFGL